MTTETLDRSSPRTAFSRVRALGTAEWLQFRRNKTILFMATIFPVGIPLVLFSIGSRGAVEAANTIDIFVLYTLLFVQFYTVLSMVTTRRDERVLKRLRTGEARDWEILGAICIPGALLSIVFTIVIVPLLMIMGAPAPVNLIPLALAVVLGLILASALAFATSGFTRNAEAAQLTSMPVITVAILGLGALRPMFGDSILASMVNYTPFAAISDLVQLGWAGATFSDSLAGAEAWSFAGVLEHSVQPLLIILGWTVLTVAVTRQYMRWDTHR
ncbi:ABC transporter permease [Corynebacterium alimapuense]|uniref:ABC-2 type transporter transmembrane domain-containing protein n=1 Tax=Corynebacterium alimapuense TaxID=1576874 RepID=A0A3M8K7V1_9CORY|nr:ABC transporter permease [Corynebacterium alimapuense]RNE48594.1 hypothetical protein C5L39_08890 [Corynebacterium alimapuense]